MQHYVYQIHLEVKPIVDIFWLRSAPSDVDGILTELKAFYGKTNINILKISPLGTCDIPVNDGTLIESESDEAQPDYVIESEGMNSE